ncbi:MAG: glycoside hydrolase family 92 protein [Cyclobacteriaceae bacterium]|nr:glycoside hydrolase family 92 protein [Cyclobacteriaceae bacterium]
MVFCGALGQSCRPPESANFDISNNIELIDPLIGTGVATTPSALQHSVSGSELRGQNYPAVGVPHGMTQWTPQTQASEKKCLPPYYYEDSQIQGFRGTHWMSGSCTQDYGSVTIMPIAGKLITDAIGRASAFYREEETARPFYYSVNLNTYDIHAEISASSRASIMKFNYNSYNKRPYIVIEPNSDEGQGYVKIDPEHNIVYGYNPAHRIYQGWGGYAGFKGYFVIQFSKPMTVYGTWEDDKVVYENTEATGDSSAVGAFVGFDYSNELVVKVGTSFTGFDGALANLQTEIPGWDIALTTEKSRMAWEKAINKIEVSGGSPEQSIKFYTALYHTYLLPRVFSDADGQYVGFAEDSAIHQASGTDYYADFSMWDTYRAVHPLMTILEPEKTADMVQSLLLKAEQGEWLPIFPAWNNYTSAMIGDHAIAMIGDATAKGIVGFDKELAWKYMKQNAFEFNADRASYLAGKGRRALDSYLKYGYIPMEDSVPDSFHQQEQTSRTLEYAYDDFVLATYAKALGKEDDYKLLISRASNWRNVFDAETGYVRGRFRDGSWYEPFDPNETRTPYITEGTPYQYTWYVPHHVYGLIDAMGGRENFIAKLDTLFETDQYWHGNEPGHQTAYMYAFAGAPWKTQQRIHQIILEEYGIGPGGLSGNEDAGQMSAWLAFSMVGFYPVCPGTPYYIIGAPSFESATLHLDNGNQLKIKANQVSPENHFIQSATLNGQAFDRAWLSHEEILRGGVLIFEMGSTPNKEWAVKNLPPNVMEE